MSQNQKLINIFNEFLNTYAGRNSYITSNFKLNESFADCVLAQCSSGGSSGGSCWGGLSSPYENSDNTRATSLASNIAYNFSSLKFELNIDNKKLQECSLKYAKKLISGHSYISEASDGGDYYGNYTKYLLYKVKLLEFIKPLIDQNQFEVLQGLISNHKKQSEIAFQNNELLTKEAEILQQLRDFDENRKQEKKQLDDKLERLKGEIRYVENTIKNFNSKSDENKNALHKKLAKVMVKLTVPDSIQNKKMKLK